MTPAVLVASFVILALLLPFATSRASIASVDSASGVIARIPIYATNAFFVTYDGANGNLYVPGWWYPAENGSLYIISGTSQRLVATVTAGLEPYEALVDPGNGDIYVSNNRPGCGNCPPSLQWTVGPGNLTVVSGTSNAPLDSVQVGYYPTGLTYDPRNGDVYVANMNSGSVSVVSTANQSVIAAINVGYAPINVYYNPFNGNLYVMDQSPQEGSNLPNHVSVISGANNSLVGSVALLGTTEGGLVIDPLNGDVYAGGSDGVSVISGITNTTVATISIPNGQPSFVDSEGNVFVLQPGSSAEVSVIDGNTNTVATNFSIGGAQEISYDPADRQIYSNNGCCGYSPVLVNVTSAVSERRIVSINVGDFGFVSAPPTYDPGNGDFYAIVEGSTTYVAVIGNVSSNIAPAGSNALWFVGGIGIGLVVGVVAAVSVVSFMGRRRRRKPTSGE